MFIAARLKEALSGGPREPRRWASGTRLRCHPSSGRLARLGIPALLPTIHNQQIVEINPEFAASATMSLAQSPPWRHVRDSVRLRGKEVEDQLVHEIGPLAGQKVAGVRDDRQPPVLERAGTAATVCSILTVVCVAGHDEHRCVDRTQCRRARCLPTPATAVSPSPRKQRGGPARRATGAGSPPGGPSNWAATAARSRLGSSLRCPLGWKFPPMLTRRRSRSGCPDRHEQSDVAAVAMADDVGGLDAERVHERDRLDRPSRRR